MRLHLRIIKSTSIPLLTIRQYSLIMCNARFDASCTLDFLRYIKNIVLNICSFRYSARFYGNTRENLLVASGTVFNEVHVWKAMDRDEDGDGVVMHRFVGHEGVIFGVRFSPDGSMLTSVSDDRTIRVWPLQGEK